MEASAKEFKRGDMPSRKTRLSELFRRALVHLDPEPERAGLEDTPDRVARMWLDEFTTGYSVKDPSRILKTFPDEDYKGHVTVKDIPVISVCEHHLVPIVGYAHIGYFPNPEIGVTGLSKFPRLVNAYARRLQVQERLTQQIIDAIEKALKPRGTIVVISAEHMCMTMRGVQAPGTRTVTCTVEGLFEEEQGAKEEFLQLVRDNR